MDRRFLLAVTLTVFVMLFFTWLQTKQIEEDRRKNPEKYAQKTEPGPPQGNDGAPAEIRPDTEPTLTSPSSVADTTRTATDANLVASSAETGSVLDVQTSVARIVLSATGGSLRSVRLPGYAEHVPDVAGFQCENSQYLKTSAPITPADFDHYDALSGTARETWFAAWQTGNKAFVNQARAELQANQKRRDLAAIEAWHGEVDPLRSALAQARGAGNQGALLDAETRLREAEALELVPYLAGYTQPLTLALKRRQQTLFSDQNLVYETSGLTREGTRTQVVFRAMEGRIGLEKSLTFFDDYHADFAITVHNNGDAILPADFGDVQVSWEGGIGRFLSKGFQIPSVIYVDGVRFRTPEDWFKDFQANKLTDKSSVSMALTQSKYFMAALIPQGESVFRPVLPDPAGITARKKDKEAPAFDMGIRVPIRQLKPGDTQTIRYTLYMGPKREEALAAVIERVEPQRIIFQRTYLLDWIRMTWICPLLLNSLKAFESFSGNFGWAIIILVIIVKVLLYPLTLKQHKNQRKMTAIQPQLKAIREKYKNEPMEAHKKSSELMRKHGVKMSGGCLPALVQMPIFVGLYFTLYYAIELRGAPFLGWITDLSEPDSLKAFCIGGSQFNLRLLPILNAIVTYLSMKQTPVADPQQAKMFALMPVIFLFIFWNFPSGLVLYWTLQSLIQFVTILLMEHVHFRDEKGGKQHA